MESKEKEEFKCKYRQKNMNSKSMKFIRIMIIICVIATIFVWFTEKEHSIVGIVNIFIFINLYVMNLMNARNNNIPDISISDTEIILTKGILRREVKIKTNDIIEINFNKFDEIIKIIIKDAKKFDINLIPFLDIDKHRIIEIFKDLTNVKNIRSEL